MDVPIFPRWSGGRSPGQGPRQAALRGTSGSLPIRKRLKGFNALSSGTKNLMIRGSRCKKKKGAESEEFTDVPFKKEAVLVACELFPFGNPPGQAETTPHAVNNWQVVSQGPFFRVVSIYRSNPFIKTALCKKYGDSMAVLPFTLKFPQGTPPSLILMGPPGVKGEPCGLTYHVIAFSCTDPSLPLLRR